MFQGQKWHGGSVGAKVKDKLSFSLCWVGSKEICWHLSWQLCASQVPTVAWWIADETRNIFIPLKEHPAFSAGGWGILCSATSVKLAGSPATESQPQIPGQDNTAGLQTWCPLSHAFNSYWSSTVGLILVLGVDFQKFTPQGLCSGSACACFVRFLHVLVFPSYKGAVCFSGSYWKATDFPLPVALSY